MASANAAGSSGGTRNPVSPSRTASGTPPAFPATTGSPHADASTSEIPNPSTPMRSVRREAPTYTAARLYSAGRSRSLTSPRKRSRATQERPRRAALQPRVVVLVLLAQQVGNVEEDAVGDFGPLVDPAGGVAGRLYVAAIHELHPVLARKAGGAARPQ